MKQRTTKKTMKSCKTSILGGGVARELLKKLGSEIDAVSTKSLPQATFNLRRAYRYSRGMWDGHTYTTRKKTTGGLLVWAWTNVKEAHSDLCGTQMLRIRPRDVVTAEKRINVWVTGLIRRLRTEQQRLAAVAQLDAFCKPLLEKPDFVAWVEHQEGVWGESDYRKLTVEACHKWMDGARKWAQTNGVVYSVNPTGQAGIAWTL